MFQLLELGLGLELELELGLELGLELWLGQTLALYALCAEKSLRQPQLRMRSALLCTHGAKQ